MKSNPIITDEMLAAYLAGNATAHEMAWILRAAETDPTIREALRIMSELESEDAIDVLPMMAMAAKNEVDNLCAIRCVGWALRHFGLDVSDQQVLHEAVQSKIFTEQGIPFGMIGDLIRQRGFYVQYTLGNSIDSLRQNLLNGIVAIALIDGGELTGDYIKEKIEDKCEGLIPDHVVFIETISDGYISIRDSYTPQQLDTYPLAVFLDAWEDSGCSLLLVYP